MDEEGARSAGAADVPHYRFSFLIAKAKELADRVAQLGSELLSTLERRDEQGLYRLQTQQEGDILVATLALRNLELQEAQKNLASLQQALLGAQKRSEVYGQWLHENFLPQEIVQRK